jgi:hypothetical protein
MIIYSDDFSNSTQVNTVRNKSFTILALPASLPREYRSKESNWWPIFTVPRRAISNIQDLLARSVGTQV